MSKQLHRKAVCMFVIEAVCMILLGMFLTVMQTRLSVQNQFENTQEKIQQIQGILDGADATSVQNTASYDEVYQSKAASVAYMANKDTGFAYTDAKMRELADRLEVSNVLIVDKDGKILAKAGDTAADFGYARYNQLRTVFTTGEPSEAFEVKNGDTTRRYYGAVIDGQREAVIEQDPAELHRIQEDTSSWKSILSNVNVGLNGFTFAVSSQDYTFLYHPDEQMAGKDSLNAGLDVEELEDSNYTWLTIGGERFYCGVKKIDADNAYVICAVPEKEITASRNITVGIVLFIFFVVITVIIVYALLIMQEQESRIGEDQDDDTVHGNFYYNKAVGKKISALALVGVVLILAVSFFMQTLFSLSLRSMSNKRQAEEVQKTLERNAEDMELLTAQYNERYLNKCQTASYILSRNPQLQTREELAGLSRVLGVEFIILFDREGTETVTDSSYVNFQISSDPEDQSYEFNKLLKGVEYVIQEAQPDELSGEYHQYIGSVLLDQSGTADGFVQISVVPGKLNEALAATKLSSVLDGIRPSGGGFAFAVDKEDMTFSWYPDKRLIGKSAVQHDMEEKQFRDGYCDYITVDDQKYYGASLETGTDYIYVVSPVSSLTGTRLPIALASAGASLICLMLVTLVLSFVRRTEAPEEKGGQEESQGNMVKVIMPDGSVRRTEAAASRWSNLTTKWADKTPGERIGAVLKGMLSLFALAICGAILFKDTFFEKDSIFLYVINGDWERNVNVFAVTACIMIICVAAVIVILLQEILRLLSKSLGARGETVCRLISNFIKYVSVIAVLYYCFALFGVDTGTLLASAGILSLVIGLGAKTLVSDILAGLFIIFEGEFQVGDIVTIGDWRGTVQEIGVRTTKIMDAGQNVKVISNSDVSGVINMTKKNSFIVSDVGIEYGESLERVESILARELPEMKKRIPAIKDGPYYKGVVSLGDNSVNIRIVAQCTESDRMQLGRDLNREMKLLFDRYDINIPFPQVVINEPKEYQKATEWEKRRADAFNQSQKKLAKGMEEENEDKE